MPHGYIWVSEYYLILEALKWRRRSKLYFKAWESYASGVFDTWTIESCLLLSFDLMCGNVPIWVLTHIRGPFGIIKVQLKYQLECSFERELLVIQMLVYLWCKIIIIIWKRSHQKAAVRDLGLEPGTKDSICLFTVVASIRDKF